jgi:hypothetical protein
MAKISKNGKGKTLYIEISVFPAGKSSPERNLTVSCPDPDTKFKTTLTDKGLQKLRSELLRLYEQHITMRI